MKRVIYTILKEILILKKDCRRQLFNGYWLNYQTF